jgi:hypothetical protein
MLYNQEIRMKNEGEFIDEDINRGNPITISK